MSLRLEILEFYWLLLKVCKELSKIASFLTNMLKDIYKFKYIEKGDRAFQVLRQWITITPILTLPVRSKHYTSYVDTLKEG